MDPAQLAAVKQAMAANGIHEHKAAAPAPAQSQSHLRILSDDVRAERHELGRYQGGHVVPSSGRRSVRAAAVGL